MSLDLKATVSDGSNPTAAALEAAHEGFTRNDLTARITLGSMQSTAEPTLLRAFEKAHLVKSDDCCAFNERRRPFWPKVGQSSRRRRLGASGFTAEGINPGSSDRPPANSRAEIFRAPTTGNGQKERSCKRACNNSTLQINTIRMRIEYSAQA